MWNALTRVGGGDTRWPGGDKVGFVVFAAGMQGSCRVARSCRAVLLTVATLWSIQSLAQTASPASDTSLSDTEFSKDSENPVTRQITLPLRYEADFRNGEDKATKHQFQINQAVVPLSLSADWAVITRTKLPVIVQPPRKHGDQWATGLGNGYTTFFLSPAYGGSFYWGAGPLLYYPATNSSVGVTEWGSGPSVAFLKKDEGPWVLGAVINNIWSFGGPPTSNRTNSMLLNPVVSYHFGDGWAVGSSPSITTSWIASGAKWTVPVGGSFSKTAELGAQPIKFALESYYNAIRPVAGNDTWLLQFTVTFVFPR
jgi:hypothetical protein